MLKRFTENEKFFMGYIYFILNGMYLAISFLLVKMLHSVYCCALSEANIVQFSYFVGIKGGIVNV